jgi:hypothetical protein
MALPFRGNLVMAAQLADARLVDSRTVYDAAERPVTAFDRIKAEGNSWMTVARSITVAVLIALPFWMLIACAVYLVL